MGSQSEVLPLPEPQRRDPLDELRARGRQGDARRPHSSDAQRRKAGAASHASSSASLVAAAKRNAILPDASGTLVRALSRGAARSGPAQPSGDVVDDGVEAGDQ
jgi:hypothetical protein